MGALEAALAQPLPGRAADWWLEVGAAIGGLRAEWARHVAATEAPGGLFDDVLDQAPWLAHAVGKLRGEHVDIADAIDSLAASDPDDGAGDGAAIRAAGLDLLGRLAHHRHLGADLLHEAYTVDVATGD